MKQELLSDYFNNEYLLLNKSEDLNSFSNEFFKYVSTVLNYKFKNSNLLVLAMTHKSFAHEVKFEMENNEKLEFLGDSVLQIIISEKIFTDFPNLNEGQLSKLRSAIVNENTLAKLAHHFNLNATLLIGKGELKNKGYNRASLLSNAFEAVLGAIYLDSNITIVKDILINSIEKYEEATGDKIISIDKINDYDSKSKLQEIVMKLYKVTPTYESEELTKKNSKEKYFKVNLKIKNTIVATTENDSKKKAMQLLAQKTLKNELYKTHKG
jgi:ribonuclease-3